MPSINKPEIFSLKNSSVLVWWLKIISLLFIMVTVGSCKKSDKKCIQVKYEMGYCPKTGASLVTLINPNSDATFNGGTYQMALLNVPVKYQVRDKVFNVSYHYDADMAKFDNNKICPAVVGPSPIFVCDTASETSCN